MLNLQVVHPHTEFVPTALSSSLHNPFLKPHGKNFSSCTLWPIRSQRLTPGRRSNGVLKTIRASIWQPATTEKSVRVKGIVTVVPSQGDFLSNFGLSTVFDSLADLSKKSVLIELVAAELDPQTGMEKQIRGDYAHWVSTTDGVVKYACDIVVPPGFGEIGAVLVENEHRKEIFVKDIVFDGFKDGPLTISCESWIHSKYDNGEKRIFFTNKSYLPSQTPHGLRRMREKELYELRGNGEGERKVFERIYDYDTYNDLGDPDKDPDMARPVLGGPKLPYPRRCRTGRERCKTDPLTEKRINEEFYVPRDEEFSEIKESTFQLKTLRSALHALIPTLETTVVEEDLCFPFFTAIDALFNESVHTPKINGKGWAFNGLIPRIAKKLSETGSELLLFETPEMIDRDKFAWLRDEEFSRQTLAGLNPYCIELVKEEDWPFESKLDEKIYGPKESKLTKRIIERQIKGYMTVEEALKQKKLFMLDYHDKFLPYVNRIRELPGRTFYGSRTLFFLTEDGTLKPIAIELTRPPNPERGQEQWSHVFTPNSSDATSCWLWKLAKVHACAHDAAYHQLISHWLRTHCCTEPYILATNRQLSAMHPIYRLLHPHFRYTIEINSLARQQLINADGIIESCFTAGKYALELSSVVYGQTWRFDMEALPADLIRRGMAVEDPTAKHGLRLTIEDYPFANDGLILWDAIKTWVSDYVNHYYPDPSSIESDFELQAWWLEIRTRGHGDKKDEPWWPQLKTPEDLIQICTIIIWVPSGHHAAVNFGQYMFAGYFPNRPTVARTKMPNEDPTEEEFKKFMARPENTLLQCYPTQAQATKVMVVLDILSTHSPDEEYIGRDIEPSWASEPQIKAAFERFSAKMTEFEGIIDERNHDLKLKNRAGAGVVPYELLKPHSGPGVTGKGVPNSISI